MVQFVGFQVNDDVTFQFDMCHSEVTMAGSQDGDNILIYAITGLRGHKLDKPEPFGGFLDTSLCVL